VTALASSLTQECRSPISNRELVGFEMLQLIENKHLRPILSANFEPNPFPVVQRGHAR
jgi:hypothetical protein